MCGSPPLGCDSLWQAFAWQGFSSFIPVGWWLMHLTGILLALFSSYCGHLFGLYSNSYVCVAFQGGPTRHVDHLEESRGVSAQHSVPVVLSRLLVHFQEPPARPFLLECLTESWTHSELDHPRITKHKSNETRSSWMQLKPVSLQTQEMCFIYFFPLS